MQANTVHFVAFTDVLSRLPDEVDREELIDFFSGWTEYAWGTNSFSLVPWSVLADDLTDCCIELGYGAPDINKIFPKTVRKAGQLWPTENIYVDLEN